METVNRFTVELWLDSDRLGNTFIQRQEGLSQASAEALRASWDLHYAKRGGYYTVLVDAEGSQVELRQQMRFNLIEAHRRLQGIDASAHRCADTHSELFDMQIRIEKILEKEGMVDRI